MQLYLNLFSGMYDEVKTLIMNLISITYTELRVLNKLVMMNFFKLPSDGIKVD